MSAPKQYEVLIRRRVPLLTTFLGTVLLVFFSILFILYLIMLPARYASGEMATAYYILVVPEFLKTLSSYSFLGLLIVAPLYYKARLHRPALLSIENDHLSIVGKQIALEIQFRKIDRVFCNGLHDLFRRPKGILQFVLKLKQHKETTFRLRYYDNGEELLKDLLTVENINISFHENEMVGEDE